MSQVWRCFVADEDPLTFYRRIFQAVDLQKGVCFVEIHEDAREALEALLANFDGAYRFKEDLQSKDRFLMYKAHEVV